MSHASPDPFSATTRLLVDGTNLLHALSSTPERAPATALVGRLRGVVPAAVAVEIIFDGIPDRGMRGERIAGGLRVRHAGRRTADALLLSLVDEIAGADGPQATAGILVVTDDRELRDRLRAKGARSAGTAWLIGRLDRGRLVAPSVGNPRPPTDPSGADRPSDDRPGWRPGRAATAKHGNPRRLPRAARRPRSPGTSG